jgi:hypothetical protein
LRVPSSCGVSTTLVTLVSLGEFRLYATHPSSKSSDARLPLYCTYDHREFTETCLPFFFPMDSSTNEGGYTPFAVALISTGRVLPGGHADLRIARGFFFFFLFVFPCLGRRHKTYGDFFFFSSGLQFSFLYVGYRLLGPLPSCQFFIPVSTFGLMKF